MTGIYQQYFIRQLHLRLGRGQDATPYEIVPFAATFVPQDNYEATYFFADPTRPVSGMGNPLDRLPARLVCLEYVIMGVLVDKQDNRSMALQRFWHKFKQPVVIDSESIYPDDDRKLFKEDDLGNLLGDARFKKAKGVQFIA